MYDIETLWQVYFHGVYEVRSTDRVVIDAGANIGLFSCWAARVARQSTIYALEPAPETFERLTQHIATNGLTNRVKCFQAAVAGRPGRLTMSTSSSASQMFRLLAPTEKVPESAVDVEVLTLHDFFEKVLADSQAARIDLLKMDIEGSEYETLLSDRLEIVDRIQVEYHATEASSVYSRAKLMQHLEGCGFRLTRHRGDVDYGMLWYER
ncbi:MAG: FkbM family methyltransferase [Acidobacteriota bacterium]|nr:FkbM family methyltransferase [Acidobacteriota bacterium]